MYKKIFSSSLSRCRLMVQYAEEGILFLLSTAQLENEIEERMNLAKEEHRQYLRKFCLNEGIKVLILDNIASLFSGLDENSRKEWDGPNQWLLGMRAAGITTILLHHLSKEGKQRGTSARMDNIDISMVMHRPPGYTSTDGCRFILTFDKHRIPHRDLSLVAPLEVQFDGESWRFSRIKKQQKFTVLQLLVTEVSQKEISRILKVTAGRVSQLKKELKQEGYLDEEEQLTDVGRDALRALNLDF